MPHRGGKSQTGILGPESVGGPGLADLDAAGALEGWGTREIHRAARAPTWTDSQFSNHETRPASKESRSRTGIEPSCSGSIRPLTQVLDKSAISAGTKLSTVSKSATRVKPLLFIILRRCCKDLQPVAKILNLDKAATRSKLNRAFT